MDIMDICTNIVINKPLSTIGTDANNIVEIDPMNANTIAKKDLLKIVRCKISSREN